MEDSGDEKKLFVGGLSKQTNEDSLRDYFSQYCTVEETAVMRDKTTGSHRGYAFVSFSDSSSVQRAVQNTHVILNKKIDVNSAAINIRSDKGSLVLKTKKIFVGGLTHSLSHEEFKSYFEKFGTITDAVVMYDKDTKRPRGFGFITFDSEDAAEDVLQKRFHELDGKLVEVKIAQPEENKKVKTPNGKDFNNHQGYWYNNYVPYPPLPLFFTGYEYISAYAGAAWYPYATNYYGQGYPAGGYFGCLPPSCMMPYGYIANICPAFHYTGVIGMMNGYNETVKLENKKRSEVSRDMHKSCSNASLDDGQKLVGVDDCSVNKSSGNLSVSENYSATSSEEEGEDSKTENSSQLL